MKRLRNRRSLVTACLSLALLMSLSAHAFGTGTLTEVRVYLNTGIKIMLNGKSFEPVDNNSGTRLVPITYKGSTYLPLRAVAEAAGMKVTWDAATETAYLGEIEGTIAKDSISYMKVTPEFVYNGSSIYRMASRTPDELKTAEGTSFSYGYVTGGSRSVNMEVTTNFQYEKFKVKVWAEDSVNEELQIKIVDENQVAVKDISVKSGTLTELELDVKDTKSLRIYVQGDTSIVGEPMLGK